MKMNLNITAILLSIIAIVITISQPTYNFLASNNSGKPSFDISGPLGFYVFQTFTRITVTNNGTATAHNIRIEVTFTNPTSFLPNHQTTLYLPELPAQRSQYLEFPIGTYQIQAAIPSIYQSTANTSTYKAHVNLYCQELDDIVTTFYFAHIIP
jgi:hypothetical protein